MHIVVDQLCHEGEALPALPDHVIWSVLSPAWPSVTRVMNLFDVIILSRFGPMDAGSEAVRTLTHSGAPPLIVLANGANEAEKVALLEAGSAYCLSSHITPRELSARIQALTTRRHTPAAHIRVLCVGRWMIDISGKRLIAPDLQIATLTPIEFELLRLFIERRGRVLTRLFLLDHLGKSGVVANDRTVDVYVSRLRHKLRNLGAGETMRLKAVWNEGYVCQTLSRPLVLRRA